MLTPAQRSKIITGIPNGDLPLVQSQQTTTANKIPDPPMIIMSYLAEGVRQRFWADDLRGSLDPDTLEWTEHRGHHARATISLVIESFSTTELQALASEVYKELWQTDAGLGGLADHMWFRGVENPVFLPDYRSETHRKNIHRCAIDYYVDYEMVWDTQVPAITAYTAEVFGDDDKIIMYDTAPGCYGMDAILI